MRRRRSKNRATCDATVRGVARIAPIAATSNDTRAIVQRLAQLRAEQAKLLGYPNYAAYALDDQMAKTPESGDQAADRPRARGHRQGARRGGADADARSTARTAASSSQPWDWQYYAEQVRKARVRPR